MLVRVNGLHREIPDGARLVDLLKADEEPIGHVIVEVNGRHIREDEYSSLALEAGDRVEVILPAFGG